MPNLNVLVVTERPAVEAQLQRVAERSRSSETPLDVVVAPRVPSAANAEGSSVWDAAVVDTESGLDAVIDTWHTLRGQAPDLPILAIMCCNHVLSVWEQQDLAEHVDTIADLHATDEELLATLRGLTRSKGVRLGWAQRTRRATGAPQVWKRSGMSRLQSDDVQLIELVAQGLSNQEVGRIMHLSRHGIDHRINRLCLGLGVRDRVELAAWAGRHGLYPPRKALANHRAS